MRTIIPERTIDSLFAFEVITAWPSAQIYSPPNNAGPGTPDHEVKVLSGSIVFELKTLSNGSYHRKKHDGTPWHVSIPKDQLSNYVRSGRKIFYVLPAQPRNVDKPWMRKCSTDPDPNHNNWCKACAAGIRSIDPVSIRRRRTGNASHWKGAATPVRLQPWFSHWAWVVSAKTLEDFVIQSIKASKHGVWDDTDNWHIPAEDKVLELIPTVERLCHLLGAASSWTSNSNIPRPTGGEQAADDTSGESQSYSDYGDGVHGFSEVSEDEFSKVMREKLEPMQWPEGGNLEIDEGSNLVIATFGSLNDPA